MTRARSELLRGTLLVAAFFGLLALSAFLAVGCVRLKPQQGGESRVTFGGASAPTTTTLAAPENSKTPSTTTIEKRTERIYEIPPTTGEAAKGLATSSDRQGFPRREHLETAPAQAVGSRDAPVAAPSSPLPAPRSLVRETVVERATTQVGTSWEDKARELGAKLANLRGVLWAGVALLVGGPVVGIKMGWPLNGAIAGLTGLVLIVLAQVIPGHEAWFGLGLLLLIPVVCWVYYRSQHDVKPTTP